ncbi:hypothetical protein, variant 1 [Capsaspora owczarzaki ATCC 30864]|uniref:HPt domain-containing protein n=1 Tax=Capsaspora owczarzaki (strain ATCC 30864) TaxID=595528 RepID=A0A0D2VN65_CAPO3|nr:hypothetical protein, variant 1 [Capsaspora owczarzaki ATCC 30864]
MRFAVCRSLPQSAQVSGFQLTMLKTPPKQKLRMDPSDNTFLLETSYELLSKAPERLSLFRQGLATGDYIALKHLAHREKGSASTLGFNRLANAMLRFEYASYLVIYQFIQPDAQQFSTLYYTIEREYSVLRDYLQKLFASQAHPAH